MGVQSATDGVKPRPCGVVEPGGVTQLLPSRHPRHASVPLMPSDGADLTHDVERVDVSMLSETQCDMLWMRLRAAAVMYVFDGGDVTVPATGSAVLTEAIGWVRKEVRSPSPGRYAVPHPYQRTLIDGAVAAPRWRRLAAAGIDSVIAGTVFAFARRLGVVTWIPFALNTVYVMARPGSGVERLASSLWRSRSSTSRSAATSPGHRAHCAGQLLVGSALLPGRLAATPIDFWSSPKQRPTHRCYGTPEDAACMTASLEPLC